MSGKKKFQVTINDVYKSVVLTVDHLDTHTGHSESFPPKVAIALGNQLIRSGRKILKGETCETSAR